MSEKTVTINSQSTNSKKKLKLGNQFVMEKNFLEYLGANKN